jgi:hypothetical protein
MAVVINGDTGISPVTASGTSASVDGMTVGRGGGEVATNTAVGTSAFVTNTTGSNNTAIGYLAGYSNSTAVGLTAVGAKALYNTTASDNCAVGTDNPGNYAAALRENTSGRFNTAIATGALGSNTTGSYNSALGHQSLASNTTASNNTAVGYQAGYSFASTGTAAITAFGYQAAYSINATDPRNTAIGYQALYTNNGGGSYENTAVGWGSAKLTTTGSGLVAMGNESLAVNTTGTKHVAIGYQALTANTTGNYNTAIGYQSGKANVTGANCTYIGYQAGFGATGSANTCIGDESGYGTNTLTSGTNNVYVGYGASGSASGNTYEIVIGGLGSITGKGSSTGFIAPGSTYGTGGGAVYQGNNSSSWSTTSDQRLKKNIVDHTEGLDKIAQIRVRNFEYRLPEEVTELDSKNAIAINGVQLGAIAQELKEILPDCVKTESTGVMSVDATNLTWYLINAVKELSARVKQLEGN